MTIQEKKELLKNVNMEEEIAQAAILGAEDQDKKTVEYKKEAVRQAIVRAVSDIEFSKGNGFERTRPIQLADVLIAIENNLMRGARGIGEIWVYDNIAHFVPYEKSSEFEWTWNLLEDYDHQSEAFYLFAWELLCE